MTEKGLLCGNNKPKDITNMTDFEKKPMPIINCPDTVRAGEAFQVKIKVGEIPHVMEEGLKEIVNIIDIDSEHFSSKEVL